MNWMTWIIPLALIVVLFLIIRLRKRIFRRRMEPSIPPMPPAPLTPEAITADNVKAKMDLVLTQMDSLKTQYEALNQRTQTIEAMVKELYNMAKS